MPAVLNSYRYQYERDPDGQATLYQLKSESREAWEEKMCLLWRDFTESTSYKSKANSTQPGRYSEKFIFVHLNLEISTV